ncbi:MAG TPA: HesA/MoeB/ThiF family protein [Polyangiaceae bacterium]|nr:HesA/MoeB/ThiF family protein [Polyangiaceae bacterium]
MSGRPAPERAAPAAEGLRVLVVGAGGIGNPAALALAASGVGVLRVLDDDLVEGPNLHRQVLFGERDVGRPKAVALAEALGARFPSVRVEPVLARALPETALELVRGVDVVVDGTDNFASRFLLADAARLGEVPIVHAAAVRWEGTCFVSGPRGRPCYRCLFEDLPEGPAPDCASAGVVGAVCGVIGGVAADLALGLGAGEAGLDGTVVSLDGRRGELRRIKASARASCPLCGEGASIQSIERGRYTAPACGALGRSKALPAAARGEGEGGGGAVEALAAGWRRMR